MTQTGDRVEARGLAAVQCQLGGVWRRQGKLDSAILSYQKALDLDPGSPTASLELGGVLRAQQRDDEAIEVFQEGLVRNPNVAELHKALIGALVERHGPAAADAYYSLQRQDERPLELEEGAILCCSVVRNEAPRLPYFLAYYRQKGISRFLIVDNGSTDGTLPYLLAQPDVSTWRSSRSFTAANFGAAWFELLLRRYGRGHWCLIIDADEILTYAGCEHRNLLQLCQDLDGQGKRVLSAVLLDMYADRPLDETHYAPGQDPLDVCPYFDRQFYHARYEDWSPYRNQTCYFGGMRQRVFGEDGAYNLSKAPLINYDLDCVLIGGQHWTNLPRAAIAAETGCLLHFKYVSTFPAYVQQETRRKEHYGHGMQYAQYARGLAGHQSLNLYDAGHSLRFQNSWQLVGLGIIQAGGTARPALEGGAVEFPPIAPLAPATTRPFWSVMITAYTRLDYLPKALRSVLQQAPDQDEMQIEVVNDAADSATQARLAAIVHEIGGDRVTVFSAPAHVGHPHIFNLCIQRARGHWVHILHDDDWIEQGFYAALAAGIRSAPDVGAAFCRQIRTNEAGGQEWVSWLERQTPGIIEHWLDRIAVMCRLQFVSVVVKRQAYEAVGGFCPQAESSFDWDMWKRLAVRFAVWYEPRPLARFFQGPASETYRLVRTGEQIAHARRAIEIATSYLPADRVDELSHRARQHQAAYALAVARGQWRHGETRAAIANLRQALDYHPTHALERELVSLLAQVEQGSPGR